MKIQEAFDKMVAHLAKQKRKAFDNVHKSCIYRTSNGMRCVVGGLLSNEAIGSIESHDLMFERVYKIMDLSNVRNELALEDCETEVEFYSEMQSAHDRMDNAKMMQEKLNDIAEKYELDNANVSLIKQWNEPKETVL